MPRTSRPRLRAARPDDVPGSPLAHEVAHLRETIAARIAGRPHELRGPEDELLLTLAAQEFGRRVTKWRKAVPDDIEFPAAITRETPLADVVEWYYVKTDLTAKIPRRNLGAVNRTLRVSELHTVGELVDHFSTPDHTRINPILLAHYLAEKQPFHEGYEKRGGYGEMGMSRVAQFQLSFRVNEFLRCLNRFGIIDEQLQWTALVLSPTVPANRQP